MWNILIRWVLPAGALLLAWCLAGRWITLQLDRVITVRHAVLPVNPMVFDGGDLRIGEIRVNLRGIGDSAATALCPATNDTAITSAHKPCFNFMIISCHQIRRWVD